MSSNVNHVNRRVFILQAIGTAAALAASRTLLAAPPLVSESDPAAQSLGYRAHAASVDKARFPKYHAGERCANCQFFGGKASDASGPCPMFAGKWVAADGWCNAYVKRA